jgi:hypothetical protein
MGLAAELIGRILRQRRGALELLVISIVDTLVGRPTPTLYRINVSRSWRPGPTRSSPAEPQQFARTSGRHSGSYLAAAPNSVRRQPGTG